MTTRRKKLLLLNKKTVMECACKALNTNDFVCVATVVRLVADATGKDYFNITNKVRNTLQREGWIK